MPPSLTPDARHHVIPAPMGPNRGREAARALYVRLFAALAGDGVTPIRRVYDDGFVVDDVDWRGKVRDGSIFGCDGRHGRVAFRMLHVFEFDGSLTARAQMWCDLAAIQAQLHDGTAAAAA